MKKWLLLLSLSMLLNAQEGLKKVVFDLTLGDQKAFEQKVLSGIVKNKDYYEGTMQELDVAVVIHGNAYKFFVKNLSTSPYKKERELLSTQESFEKRLRSLANNYNVKFYICQAGLNYLKIPKENIYDFVTPVATATIGLIDRQSEGYVYVPIR
ncbi:MAG: DsrE family protein [Epsilonproteobacteria bacterium]|nr:DsrE family protein [Campylobacterota bacterium]